MITISLQILLMTYLLVSTVTATANEEARAGRPIVGSHWPTTPWEMYDFAQGFVIGAYSPIIKRAYAGECFS